MKCLNCNSELIQQKGKREKVFCNSTCRSNYWQKAKRLEKEGVPPEEISKQIKTSNKKEAKQANAPIRKVFEKTSEETRPVKSKNQMPAGLDKIAQLRWLRENK